MKIPAAESQILEALWRRAPLTFDELVAEAAPANGWTANTVRTLVTRLLSKKAIVGAKEEAAYVYRPALARSTYVQAESQTFINRLFDGEVTPLVASLAEHRTLSRADLRKLEALIAELKAGDEDA